MQRQPARWAILIVILTTELIEGQLDFLTKITIPQYYAGTELVYRLLGSIPNHMESMRLGKLQRAYMDMPFPCDVRNGRSPERPISVHALRPGDIDVIGAMGDSLTAANGALASDILHVIVANRGVSFSGGGQGNWRQYLTLANILKVFNPNLIGYSLGDAVTWDRMAQFNVAEPGAMSSDMAHQAKILKQRMVTDTRINFKEDWKLVTLMFGPNDFCYNVCYSKYESVLSQHRYELQEALDFLYKNVPRLLVNIIPPPNLKVLVEMVDRPLSCVISTTAECPCLIGLPHANKRQRLYELMDAWQKMDVEIGNSSRYRSKDDFAIIIQPFSTDVTFPTKEDPILGRNTTDYSYLSADCFHFSQKCDAVTANALWNNMLEPVGRKSTDWTFPEFKRFLCPTEKNPYIFTHKNSPAA